MKKTLSFVCAAALAVVGASSVIAESTDPVFRVGVYGEGNAVIPLGKDNKDLIDYANDNSVLAGLGGGVAFEYGFPFLLAGFTNGFSVHLAGAGLLPTAKGITSASFGQATLGYWVRFPLGDSDFSFQPELDYGFITKSGKANGESGSETDQLARLGLSFRYTPASVLNGHFECEFTPQVGIETVGMGSKHDTEHNIYAGARLGVLFVFGNTGAAGEKAKAAKLRRAEEEVRSLNLTDVAVSRSELGTTYSLINIRFLPDSAELEESELTKLDKLATILKKSKFDLLVTGHCAATTDTESDMSLSVERAETVANYLIKQGVRKSTNISSQGKGSTEPIGDNLTEEGRIKNRRVEITVLENKKR